MKRCMLAAAAAAVFLSGCRGSSPDSNAAARAASRPAATRPCTAPAARPAPMDEARLIRLIGELAATPATMSSGTTTIPAAGNSAATSTTMPAATNPASGAAPAATQPANVIGTVTAVKGDIASINVGSAKGVKRGMVAIVSRGAKFICEIQIEEVDINQSAGIITKRSQDPAMGDKVVIRGEK